MEITVVSLICLVYMLGVALYVALRLSTRNRTKRLAYLRNFKKGNFALIYFAAIPLFYLGLANSGMTNPVFTFLEAFADSVELVVLKFDYDAVEKLVAVNVFYAAAVYSCLVLVVVNAVLFTVTLFAQKLSNRLRVAKAVASDKVFVIVGYDDKNGQILQSVLQKGERVLVLNAFSRQFADEMYIARAPYVNFDGQNLSAALTKLFGDFSNNTVNVVLNCGDETNLKYCSQLSEEIVNHTYSQHNFDEKRGLYVYSFGEPQNASVFTRYCEITKGRINLVNKYRLTAMDFVNRYPLTQFMTESHLDYETASLKPDLDVNVVMIGFGKTNQQLFLTSVSNNQFGVFESGGYKAKPVNYYIYDKADARSDKNLNHNYFRFEEALKDIQNHKADYLEIPPKPANEYFIRKDINDTEFYSSVREKLMPQEGRRSYNYVIVAFGTDLQNVDLGEKLYAELKEWGLLQDTHLFVKIRDHALASEVVQKEFEETGIFRVFGDERRTVYNISAVVDENAEKTARERHISYCAEYHRDKDESQLAQTAREEWYGRFTQIQRESNIYGCLSLRMKLQLMGFDFAVRGTAQSAEKPFWDKYLQNDEIVYGETSVGGRRAVVHKNSDFERRSLRRIFAEQEHLRWNAFYICNGVVPATRKEIASPSKGKRLDIRRHGNLTTFEGLKEYARIVAETAGKTEEETDVIRYDYQLMDDAAYFLGKAGCVITKKHL
ncbi:MAG: hypothetical protein NC350_02325 [Corallococcus sp.]|nr:hypothetical protein [Corallococcus sp.]